MVSDLLKAFLWNLGIKVTHLQVNFSNQLGVTVPKIDFTQVTYGMPSVAGKSLLECLLVSKNLSFKEVQVSFLSETILRLTTIRTSFHSQRAATSSPHTAAHSLQVRTQVASC